MKIVLSPSYIFFKEISYDEVERVKSQYTHMSPGHWFAPSYKNWKQYNELLTDIANGTFNGTPQEAYNLKAQLGSLRMWDGKMTFYDYKKKTLPIGFLSEILSNFQII